jgi:serine/threonine protein kinase
VKLERFARIKEILYKVDDLPEDEQKAYLDELCKNDPDLYQEVDSLLDHEKKHPGFLSATLSFFRNLEESIDMTGQTLSHFKIKEKIAMGGMGVLYKAIDTNLRRHVAIKVLRPDLLEHSESRKRFIREARAASALNHPGIVTVYDIGKESGVDYIVMEYVEGCTLNEKITSKGLPLEAVTSYALAIVNALKVAHEKGIVHRDLKPSNIMITNDDIVKILDFGIAKRLSITNGEKAEDPSVSQLTQTGSVIGTIGYMSPEQIKGENVDHRSDIFSFGVILYELITGKSPFNKDTTVATMHAIVHEDPEPLRKCREEIPEALERIANKALAKVRESRYQKTSDLADDLDRFQNGQEVLHAPVIRPKVKSLAVLYLKNLGKEDDEYLSYGITEDLIVDLTRIGTLRVAPMRSIIKHKDSDADLEDIARRLEVGMVLDGSIYQSKSMIRVSAQLVDVLTGKNLWANRWEEPNENLPNVKQSLAEGIRRALKVDTKVVKLAQVGAPEARNPQAYEYYLRGKYTLEHRKDEGDLEVASGLFRQAFSLESSLLAACAGIARTLIIKHEYEEADRLLMSALEDARNRSLLADEANILNVLIDLHSFQSEFDKALEYGERALEIRIEMNDLAGEAQTLAGLISVLNKQSKFAEALELSKRIFEIHISLNDQEKSAAALRNIGSMYTNVGEYDRAMTLSEESLKIARKRGDNALEGACLVNIGIINQYTGNLDEALYHFEQALEIHTKLGNKYGRSASFHNIAVVLLSKGDYRKALEMFDKASIINKEIGFHVEYALTLCNISLIYSIIGEYDRAIQAANNALVIFEDLDSPIERAVANLYLGMAHFYEGAYESAQEHSLIALEISNQNSLRREITSSHALLGELHYYQEEYDISRDHLEEASVIAEEIEYKEAVLTVSAYLAAMMVYEGQFEAGVRQLKEIRNVSEEYGDPQNILKALRLLGQILLENGRNESEQKEGQSILEEALALAKQKEIAFEIKWISEILQPSPDPPH